ncbi:MAG: LamG-like jellyroll fold domain-containing protein [Planctomycetaceae bacterium]
MKCCSKLCFTLVVCALLQTSLSGSAGAEDALIGRWKLAGDEKDSSPRANATKNLGADLQGVGRDDKPGSAAAFDGQDDALEVADGPALDLGRNEFTISVHVHTDESLDDALGDIIGKYDSRLRKGFHFGFQHNVGVPSCQANYRQLQFGIDDGKLDKEWTDHGRPGNAMLIFALAEFDGSLYAGTCEAGETESGGVYRFDAANNSWINCGIPSKANSVSALAVYRGKLYAASTKYRLRGSALGESMNPHLGGAIYRYDGGTDWTLCGSLPQTEAVGGLVVFRDRLYASSLYAPAGFFRYEGGSVWTSCAVPNQKRVEALTVYNGGLYATGYDEGAIYRFDGEKWTHCGRLANNTQTYSFAVLDGRMRVGTWPTGKVYGYQADNKWIDEGRLGEELEVMGMSAYNGQLYAGTLPLADVYRFDGGTSWTKIGNVDSTPDVKYRRAWSMSVHSGRLFVGTLPSGKVLSIEAGKSATCGSQLAPGWHHVAAVKGKDRLRIYVDGAQVAESTTFDPDAYDLSNDAPLTIGKGPTDYFNGRLSDLKIFNRALDASEIGQIAAAVPFSSVEPVGNQKNPQAVEEVLSRKRDVANAAWWGFDVEDSTDALQAAIHSGAKKLIIPKMSSDWIVRPIKLAGNQELVLENGVNIVAKRGEYRGGGDSVFTATEVSNLKISGYGAAIRMQKEDYIVGSVLDNLGWQRWFGPYKKAEWRMALALRGCENVEVHGLKLCDSGGDGLYIDGAGKLPASRNIHIKDVLCDNNYRQGISIISVENLLVEESSFNNTWGTPPSAGVDIEPDSPKQRVQNVVFRNCRFNDNYGDGIEIFLPHLKKESGDVSILFENCSVSSHRGSGIRVSKVSEDGPGGLIEFRNCTVENTEGYGIKVQDKDAKSARLKFIDCKVRNTANNRAYDGTWTPVWLHLFRPELTKTPGGVDFINCEIEDDHPRPAVEVLSEAGLFDVTGTIAVTNPHGAKAVLGEKQDGVTLRIEPR